MDKIEEIKKLKELLDEGVITEEDFSIQKQKIFDLSNEVEDEQEESKSLDDYEKQLMQEAKAIESEELIEGKKDNTDFYERVKIRERAKLDAQEESREEREQKRRKELNQAANSTKRVFKWILSVFCIMMAIGSFATSPESGVIYIPFGIIFLILGLMACPKITDYTVKFEKYTKYKKIIVIALIIIFCILANI